MKLPNVAPGTQMPGAFHATFDNLLFIELNRCAVEAETNGALKN